MLLTQLRVGETLATNAVAQQLVLNLIEHAATYKQEFRSVAAAVEGAPPLAATLDKIGLKYEPASDPTQAITNEKIQIAVVHASPAHLKALAEHKAGLDAFLERGGYVLLNGLTPEGLESYNAIVGFEHMIRPFVRERVHVPERQGPAHGGADAGRCRAVFVRADLPLAGGEFRLVGDVQLRGRSSTTSRRSRSSRTTS